MPSDSELSPKTSTSPRARNSPSSTVEPVVVSPSKDKDSKRGEDLNNRSDAITKAATSTRYGTGLGASSDAPLKLNPSSRLRTGENENNATTGCPGAGAVSTTNRSTRSTPSDTLTNSTAGGNNGKDGSNKLIPNPNSWNPDPNPIPNPNSWNPDPDNCSTTISGSGSSSSAASGASASGISGIGSGSSTKNSTKNSTVTSNLSNVTTKIYNSNNPLNLHKLQTMSLHTNSSGKKVGIVIQRLVRRGIVLVRAGEWDQRDRWDLSAVETDHRGCLAAVVL